MSNVPLFKIKDKMKKKIEGLSGEEKKLYQEKLRIINDLSDREKRVIQERLGLNVSRGMSKSRSEVRKMFALSEKTLRRVEEKAKELLSK